MYFASVVCIIGPCDYPASYVVSCGRSNHMIDAGCSILSTTQADSSGENPAGVMCIGICICGTPYVCHLISFCLYTSMDRRSP